MRSPNSSQRGPAVGPQSAASPPGADPPVEQILEATGGKIAISVPRMAELLSISRPTAYQLARRTDFPAFTVGGRTLVSVSGLVQWVAEQARQEGGGE